jgi:hypothetical protein
MPSPVAQADAYGTDATSLAALRLQSLPSDSHLIQHVSDIVSMAIINIGRQGKIDGAKLQGALL